MTINETFGTISTTLKGVLALGISLMVVFLVVDVLFPGTTNIVNNVAGLVNTFIGHGLVGLITLIIFFAMYESD
ncbi:MAG: hypothetical protein JKY93_08445 [Gammaproteobacteria bacterium]|nr:hypothetical protein [Gammaproteobacteria bacterium]